MASQIVIDEMEAASTLTPVESSANQWQRISRFHKLIELIEDVADVYYLCIYIIIYNYIIYYNYIYVYIYIGVYVAYFKIKGDPTPPGFQKIRCQLHPSPVTRPNCKQQLHGRRCQWIDQGVMGRAHCDPTKLASCMFND
jgi:hypothetical protein